MCPMGKIAACQIAFTPIESDDYITDIHRVLDIIERSELEFEVGVMSTFIRGDKDRLIRLLNDIYDNMNDICSFVMDIKLSNICGCK